HLYRLRRRDVDQHRCDIAWLRFVRQPVEEQLLDAMRRPLAKLAQASVARQPCGVAYELAESCMVGVLIGDTARRQHDTRPDPSDDARERDRMRRPDLEM